MATMATRKHITIRDDQADAVDDENLNLSRFVQDALDERLDEVEA